MVEWPCIFPSTSATMKTLPKYRFLGLVSDAFYRLLVGSLFCGVVRGVLSSLAIIQLRKRELVALVLSLVTSDTR